MENKRSDKDAIRDAILNRRSGMHAQEVYRKSLIIADKLLKMEHFEKSALIMCYMDFKNEVMTQYFIEQALCQGKRIAVPVVLKGAGRKELAAYEITCINDACNCGAFGIKEPDTSVCRRIEPACIDMVVVPGVAFDENMNRVGYGAGYYDLFLSAVRDDCVKAGVGFETQIVGNLPAEPHDIRMDLIITEDRTIFLKGY